MAGDTCTTRRLTEASAGPNEGPRIAPKQCGSTALCWIRTRCLFDLLVGSGEAQMDFSSSGCRALPAKFGTLADLIMAMCPEHQDAQLDKLETQGLRALPSQTLEPCATETPPKVLALGSWKLVGSLRHAILVHAPSRGV